MHRQVFLGIVALAVSAVSAEAQAPKSGRKCTPAVIDTVRYGKAPINRDCDVEKPAKLKHDELPSYRLPAGIGCARVEMLFVVDSSGNVVTGSASVISTNDPGYAERLVATLPKWRYEPARKGKLTVAQLVLERHVRPEDTFTAGRLNTDVDRNQMEVTPPMATQPCR